MRWLQQRMNGFRAIVALFALMFAFGPSLQSAACAIEGCGAACLLQDGEVSARPAAGQHDKGNPGCPGQGCVCAAAHCSHATAAPMTGTTLAVPATAGAFVVAEAAPAVSFSQNGPERPPRT